MRLPATHTFSRREIDAALAATPAGATATTGTQHSAAAINGSGAMSTPARAGLQAHYVELLCLQARRMRAIPRLARAAEGDLDRLLAAVCAEVPQLFPADGAVLLLDDGHGTMRVRMGVGLVDGAARRVSIATLDLIALSEEHGIAARLGGSLAERTFGALYQAGLRSLLCAPLYWRGQPAGALVIGRSDESWRFTEDDALYAEVLATFVGGRFGELGLQRSVARLQRALWETARRAGMVEAERAGDGERRREPA